MAVSFKLIPTPISRQMDPRLQRAIARQRFGLGTMATSSTGSDEIAVAAKVRSVKKWEALSEVRIGADLGKSDGVSLVTARVPISRIDYLRSLDFVESLKAAHPIRPMLAASVRETNAARDVLPQQSLSNGGAGCVVGVIDYGCDFAHKNFLKPDGTTRLLGIWNQDGSPTFDSPFGYGREFSREEINAALATGSPYDALGYGPAPDFMFGPKGSHGTHVMDIAAGNGIGSGAAGFAPNADLVFVHMSHTDIPTDGPSVVGADFGDSVHLLEAVGYIFEKAGGRPCVINISMGTNGGPHDGSTPVEEGLDLLVRAAPGRAITIAASNSFADGIHATGKVTKSKPADIVWEIPNGDPSHNELEIWFSGEDRFDAELIQPDGTSLGVLPPGTNGTVTDGNQVVLFAANRLADPNNADNTVGIFMEKNTAPGQWTVRLHGKEVKDGRYHAWIERDNWFPSRFAPPHDNSHTLGSVSCGQETIVVSSYDAHKPNLPISFFSSAGPTRDGRQKPELAAPGHDVLAAHSRTKTGVVRKSGTSMAAPAACGIIALMLSEAQARGIALSTDQIRDILIKTARLTPPLRAGWNARYGNGRIDAKAAIEQVMRLSSGPLIAEAPSTSKSKPKKRSGAKKTKHRA